MPDCSDRAPPTETVQLQHAAEIGAKGALTVCGVLHSYVQAHTYGTHNKATQWHQNQRNVQLRAGEKSVARRTSTANPAEGTHTKAMHNLSIS